jgi:threonine aldolase
MAADLARRLAAIPGVSLMFPAQANAVFASMPEPALERLRTAGWLFYTFIGLGGARFMCAWDTTPAHIDALVADVAQAVSDSG